jgi:hypothetical protein
LITVTAVLQHTVTQQQYQASGAKNAGA